MTSLIQAKCFQCENFETALALGDWPDTRRSPRVEGTVAYFCAAFPEGDGIPGEVLLWDEPHTSPREDQEGEFIFSPTIALVEANPLPEDGVRS